jgi:hypothetical protein
VLVGIRAILYQELMMPPIKSKQTLKALFADQPCWMIEPLAAATGYAIHSVRRFLAEIGYFSSFTHNGKWYTLKDIPRFNHEGLWFYEAIGFSRSGSLTQTIVHLADRSQAGLTAEQIGQKLRGRCHSVLVQLVRTGQLQRYKVGRSHVYLSVNPSISTLQQQLIDQRQLSLAPLPAEIAVLVLAEAIRYPNRSYAQLAQAIKRSRGVSIETAQIEALFAAHGLKKNPRTGASRSSVH